MDAENAFIRTEFNYDRELASDLSGLDCSKVIVGGDVDTDGHPNEGDDNPSKAQQSFAEEADINTIVKRFGLTGQLPSNIRMPINGDFSDLPDFRQAMDMIVQARESFDAMPAAVRARFHNDPAEFVDFCSREENRDEAVKLGLVPPADAAAKAAAAALAARADEQLALETAIASKRPKPLQGS